MTPAERAALVRHLVAEVRPDIQRLIRNYQSTLGRPITDDELADFDLAARVINQIGEDLLRLTAGHRG
ncbi:hypothetical protein BH23CHL7_BH23CHL7_17270 [soil metagenome]